MLGIFKKSTPSKDIARDRLKMILVTDRVDTSAHIMEMIKNDIIMVLSKYVEIEHSELDIQVSQASYEDTAPMPVLYANIPIKNMRKYRANV